MPPLHNLDLRMRQHYLPHIPDQTSLAFPLLFQNDAMGAFNEWARFYEKEYAPEERVARFQAWQSNLEKVRSRGRSNSGEYSIGMNGHADLTTEEFRLRYFGENPTDMVEEMQKEEMTNNKGWQKFQKPWTFDETVPAKTVDWTKENVIGHVKDQHVNGSKCGCCYAFGGVAGIEAADALYTGKGVTPLSEQQIVDCDPYDHGCHGGGFLNVWRYTIENGGIDTEAHWPYVANETGHCHHRREKRRTVTSIDHIVTIPERSEHALMQSLTHTPTSVAVCCGAFLDDWHLYTGGMFNESAHCTHPLDHAVLAVGYGTDDQGRDYFKIKNSWGAHWGDEGFIYLRRGVEEPRGQNGLATFPAFPVKTTPSPKARVDNDLGRKGAEKLAAAF
ncbi:papain family cysteine protease [Helicosporidium sp. ATCC 50920]|nr:papain family cysteine protease [Helicosporidium sp. ATCC 50920]|eukprot:KDD74236.1 papain family cysteine protease [Helicosporidium sp. ATCC 50920]